MLVPLSTYLKPCYLKTRVYTSSLPPPSLTPSPFHPMTQNKVFIHLFILFFTAYLKDILCTRIHINILPPKSLGLKMGAPLNQSFFSPWQIQVSSPSQPLIMNPLVGQSLVLFPLTTSGPYTAFAPHATHVPYAPHITQTSHPMTPQCVSYSNHYNFPNPPFYQYQGPLQASHSTVLNNPPLLAPPQPTPTCKCQNAATSGHGRGGGRKQAHAAKVPEAALTSTHCTIGPSDATAATADENCHRAACRRARELLRGKGECV